MRKLVVVFALLSLLQVTPAWAYIGPGAGAGTIAIVVGILSSVFLAFVGILWYPIKRLLKRRKASIKSSSIDSNRDGNDSGGGSSE